MVYVGLKYKNIKVPFYFLMMTFLSILFSIATGYFIDNYILVLFLSVLIFVTTFYMIYSADDNDKKVLYEFLPKKLYSYLPSKYKLTYDE
jgi:uncharacterized membrane protein YfcA